MTTVEDILTYVTERSGHDLNPDEGVRLGEASQEVRRVLVCFVPSVPALRYAGEHGYDLVLGHEKLYHPYDPLVRREDHPNWASWPSNVVRRELLKQYGMTYARVHGTLDELLVFDAFAELLGLRDPHYEKGFTKVYEITPRPIEELVREVKRRMGLSRIRVSLPRGPRQMVHRVGLPWGGLGLFVNVSYQQELVAQGVDALIAGESDDYGFRFSADLGIPMIETSHVASENPGLRIFAKELAEAFPSLEVLYYPCEPAWQIL